MEEEHCPHCDEITNWMEEERECIFAGKAFKRDEYPAIGFYGGSDCGQLSGIPSDTRR